MTFPTTTRYGCPLLHCSWFYDEVIDHGSYHEGAPNAMKLVSLEGVSRKTERELQRHIDTHPRADFLITIKELRQQLQQTHNGLIVP